MTLEEAKIEIAQRTGVPVDLLQGETAEEYLAHALALKAYKKTTEVNTPVSKSNSEQFADWFKAKYSDEEEDNTEAELIELKNIAAEADGRLGYFKDASADSAPLPDGRTTSEQFADWFRDRTAYDPRKNATEASFRSSL